MKRLLLTAALTLTLTACAGLGHVEYDCPINGPSTPNCSSMEDAYKLSRNTTNSGSSVFENKAAASAQAAAIPYFGEHSNYPATQTGMPVFQQPKVMRVWLAPYVDADGNLRSGEYTYFATPGAWNYGTLQSPGEASGVFKPSNPNSLGFNPVAAPTGKDNSRPNTPEGRPAAPNTQTAVQPNSAGITQPYQRITH